MVGRNSYASELKQLENLLTRLNKMEDRNNKKDSASSTSVSEGGRKKVARRHRSANNKDMRHFVLVEVNGRHIQDRGIYSINRESGSPRSAASKAFTQLCEKRRMKDKCEVRFAIRETTQGSKKKVYFYHGKRVSLKKADVKVIERDDGTQVKFTHKNLIKSLGSESQKGGGWLYYS